MNQHFKAGLSDTPGAIKARERRITRGIETEARAVEFSRNISLQSMIRQPLLDTLAECGGTARPKDIYDAIADRMNLDQGAAAETKTCADGQTYKYFEQQVRWARQTAVADGLIAGERGRWELTDEAYAKLGRIRRGLSVLIYRTDDGLALWGHAEDAASHIEAGSVKLVLTSPPYPVVDRSYGRFDVPTWLAWMHHLAGIWKNLIADDGTIAINVMDVFVPGTPMLSPYVERFTLAAIDNLGLHLAGRMPWVSPTKMGSLQWTAKERAHPKNTMEHILLFSKTPRPDWNIDRMERPKYAQKQVIKQGRDVRPSGLDINEAAFARNEDGPLPSNVIVAGGASGSDRYSRRCRENGMTPHPARYPSLLPRQIILMTTQPGEVCYDPMAGSNTTGQVASELGRRWISSEPMLDFAQSSAFRFDARKDFRSFDIAA